MHVVLIRAPTPGSVHIDSDIVKRVEIKLPKTPMSAARIPINIRSMPKVKNFTIEVAHLGQDRTMEGFCPSEIAISLAVIHVMAVDQLIEALVRRTG